MLHSKEELRKELVSISMLTTILVIAMAALYQYDLQSGAVGTWSSWLYERVIG